MAKLVLYEGRPADESGRSEREIRTYDCLLTLLDEVHFIKRYAVKTVIESDWLDDIRDAILIGNMLRHYTASTPIKPVIAKSLWESAAMHNAFDWHT